MLKPTTNVILTKIALFSVNILKVSKQETNLKLPDNVEEVEEDEEEEEEEKEDGKGGNESKQVNEISKLGVTETDSTKRSATIVDSPENHDINTNEPKKKSFRTVYSWRLTGKL